MDSEEERLVLDKLKIKDKKPIFIYVLTFLSAIGGFLFGYDTGIVAGAMLLLKKTFTLSDVWQELIVSITIGFAWVFSLLAGMLTDFFGRKPVVILASFIFTTGSVVMGISRTKEIVLVGRSVVGIGIGLASMSVPMYIAEMSPSNIRGRLVTLNNVFITGGQFVASLVAGAFSTDEVNGWRYMLGLAGVPSFVQFFSFFVMPESPRWLIQKGRYQQAISVLRRIRGQTANIEEEFESIKNNCSEMEREMATRGSTPIGIQVLQNPVLRRALMVGCFLQVFQQVGGINTVMYYSATIIEMSGVRDSSKAIWMASATGAMNFGCTFIGLYLVERIGRRSLTLGSLGGVIISLLLLATGFYVAGINSPPVENPKPSPNDTKCSPFKFCSPCIEMEGCGFCYRDLTSGPANGSCMAMSDKNKQLSFREPCNVENPPEAYFFTTEWCPSEYSWMILAGLLLYLFFFAPGMGPMPWTINSEIYPLWARGFCLSLATSFTWLLNLAVSMSFLSLTKAITKYGAFCLYAGLSVLGWIFFYLMLPETKGKTLEEMEGLFAHPWWKDATTINDNKTIQPSERRETKDGTPLDQIQDIANNSKEAVEKIAEATGSEVGQEAKENLANHVMEKY